MTTAEKSGHTTGSDTPFAETDTRIWEALLDHQTRPTPERIDALWEFKRSEINRNNLDRAFAACEFVSISSDPLQAGFDPACPRLDADTVRSVLEGNPENRRWLSQVMNRERKRFGLTLSEDLVVAADQLLTYLVQEVSFWEWTRRIQNLAIA
ncbi:MAG: hypothetical protein ACOCW9_08965, partial [Thermodesulfobacteriota bacterium]